jgi:hypothetical protein
MNPPIPQKDLLVLVADKNAESAVRGLLTRSRSLEIREIAVDIYLHPEKDSGCLTRGQDFLRPFINSHAHALILFDREGSGQEQETRAALENEVEKRLEASGWEGRSAAIVFDPELDIWVWSDSPHVEKILSWRDRDPDLRSWLRQQGLLIGGHTKPERPKEALEKALREVRKPRSSELYRRLAEHVSLSRCRDPAFLKFKETLRKWFPEEES